MKLMLIARPVSEPKYQSTTRSLSDGETAWMIMQQSWVGVLRTVRHSVLNLKLNQALRITNSFPQDTTIFQRINSAQMTRHVFKTITMNACLAVPS